MAFYIPVQNARAFRREKGYDMVDWSNFREVLNDFHGRMDDWYIIPAKELGKNGHFVFPVMAMDCLLIDTLSQYYYGAEFCIRLTFHSTALFIAWRTCWTFKPAAPPSMPTALTVQL